MIATQESTSTVTAEPAEWVPLSVIQRLTGFTTNRIKSAAIAGSIRVHAVAGMRTLYSRSDALRAVQLPIAS